MAIPAPIPMPAITSDPLCSEQWALHHLRVPAGWACVPGTSGVVVSVVDSGIADNHQDLQIRLLPPDTVIGAATGDDDDHGTMVAGAIAAVTGNAIGIAGATGTANVQILSVKFCSQQRWPDPAPGETAILRAVNFDPLDTRKRVIVLAWDVGYDTVGLQNAIALAGTKDALVVVAAGNHSQNNDRYPNWPANHGSMPHVITVMATDSDDERAPFSNYGQNTVHIAAPGRNPRYDTLSTAPYWGPPPVQRWIRIGYRNFGGTSAATAYVVALAALVRVKNPGMAAPQVKNHLIASARPVAALANFCVAGGVADFQLALCP